MPINYKKQLAEKDKIIQELNNRIKYLQADFDNLRKNFEKEKQQLISIASHSLMKDLLPVLDDLDNAMRNEKDEKNLQGIKMIHEKLLKTLSSKGLKPIKCVGEKFNPELHEAFMRKGDNDLVVEELQKGYLINNYVLRTSKVVVGGDMNDERENNRN